MWLTNVSNIPREDFLIQLMNYIRIPYRWGGKDPATGLDCSGLVYNILKYAGYNVNYSAEDMYDYFKDRCTLVLPGSCDLGDLIFYGNKSRLHHVAMALNDQLMIEAARGGPTITSPEMAQKANAYVTVSPIARLPDLYAIIRLTLPGF